MKFYRYSDKAVQKLDLDFQDQLTLFVCQKGHDKVSFIIDPYRKCLIGSCLKKVSGISREDIENITKYVGIDADFTVDSFYTKINSDDLLDGTYFKRYCNNEFLQKHLKEYEEFISSTLFPKQNVVRFNGKNKEFIIYSEDGNIVESVYLENTKINPYYCSTRSIYDYNDKMHWVGLISLEDIEKIKANSEKTFAFINAITLSFIIKNPSHYDYICDEYLTLPFKPCIPNEDGTFNNTQGVDFEASIQQDLHKYNEDRKEVLDIIEKVKSYH